MARGASNSDHKGVAYVGHRWESGVGSDVCLSGALVSHASRRGADRRNGVVAGVSAGKWPLKSETGLKHCRELFCLPIFLGFPYEIPESWLEAVLTMACRHLNLQDEVNIRLHDNGLKPLLVLNEFFPVSGIKRASLQQVQDAVRVRSVSELRSVTSAWSAKPDTPMRQSDTFLFYLLGLHLGPCSEHFRDGAVCGPLAASIARFVGDTFGSTVMVQAKLFRGFFDGLFDGIWMYQDARLSRIAARAKQRAPSSEVSAEIDVEVGMATHRIILQLSSGLTVLFHDRFCLMGRPSDDPSLSVARIRATLERMGVTRITVVGVASREERLARFFSRRGETAPRLSMPL